MKQYKLLLVTILMFFMTGCSSAEDQLLEQFPDYNEIIESLSSDKQKQLSSIAKENKDYTFEEVYEQNFYDENSDFLSFVIQDKAKNLQSLLKENTNIELKFPQLINDGEQLWSASYDVYVDGTKTDGNVRLAWNNSTNSYAGATVFFGENGSFTDNELLCKYVIMTGTDPFNNISESRADSIVRWCRNYNSYTVSSDFDIYIMNQNLFVFPYKF